MKKMPSLHGMGVLKAAASAASELPPPAEDSCVIVVDTFSTGAVVAHEAMKRGHRVVCVVSFKDSGAIADMVPAGLELNFVATLGYDDTLEDQDQALTNLVADLEKGGFTNVLAVMPGAETGVKLCDRLSEKLGVRTNGSAGTEARRNKYDMGEKVRAAGARAVMQVQATTWGEIQTFLDNWELTKTPEIFEAIVKPVESAGSDDVTLCKSVDEVKAAFGNIMGKRNGLGQINEAVLVQEYLSGVEYVVDTMSCDGEHKVCTLWEYDRQPTNGAGFVLHGQRCMTADEPLAQELIVYLKQVLDALEIRNGPGHAEVKMCRGTPCLVEVGARCHGAEGFWCDVIDKCIGYNQANVLVDTYLNPESFAALPAEAGATERKGYGHIKFLLSYIRGKNLRISQAALDEICAMPSYLGHEMLVKEGADVVPTIDCFTWAGSVKLAHEDEAVVNADYARIHELEMIGGGLFECDPADEAGATDAATPRDAVVVVDPFSTGAVVAANANKFGVPVICVYSAKLENLKEVENLVPQGLELHFDHVIGQESDDAKEAVAQTLAKIGGLPLNVIAVLAGAETGVGMADKLSDALGVRTNGADSTEPRRNKYLMGEKVRAAGVRAVAQRECGSWEDVVSFLEESGLEAHEPYRIICKPTESAGSDGVTLCKSRDEVEAAFKKLNKSTNQLGMWNEEVLVQEFLDGEEYVVDTVSRDGEHTTVACWHYDKRPANGQFNVYYGQHALTLDEGPSQECIAYIHKVLDALEIRNGPSHAEVKLCRGEPCLVEVGARCHGAEGAWIDCADFIYGYNQAQVTLDAYINPDAFASVPKLPTTRKGHGALAFMVSYSSGVLKNVNEKYLEEIRGFKSFVAMEIFLKPGQKVSPTVDCFTFVGNMRLAHNDEAIVTADYERVREIESADDFLIYE